MRLFELFQNHNALPAVVYHATSEAAWEEIKASNSLNSGKRKGISFTTSMKVAREFARFAAGRDDCEKGVVIEINLGKLAKEYNVVPYKDRHTSAIWHIKDEKEMKAMTKSIPNISNYIIDTNLVWRDSHDEIFEDTLNERIHIDPIREQAAEAIFRVLLGPFNGVKERILTIEDALNIIAHRYSQQWKSGIKNERGYEHEKMALVVSIKVSEKSGGGFGSKYINMDGYEMKVSKIILNFPIYAELEEDRVPRKFAVKFAHQLADAFAHETMHYTQEVKIKTADKSRDYKIRNLQSLPAHPDEVRDDVWRTRYRSKINEIDAYAANAASELVNAVGREAAIRMMGKFSDLAEHSPTITKYIEFVKGKRPKAWRRFMSQVGWHLENDTK